jgi:tRNA threonylcarbamoyladenosine modification (KEOPS) complex  Pcc1 subunit
MEAKLKVEFADEETAQKAYRSLIQETKFKKRSVTKMKVAKNSLLIEIKADSFPVLRASLNSYLRLLNVIYSVLKVSKR